MQNVLIGENLGGCASVCGVHRHGENSIFQCVCCQQLVILEKTHSVLYLLMY